MADENMWGVELVKCEYCDNDTFLTCSNQIIRLQVWNIHEDMTRDDST
jgi:hypothetical protein